ncbi:hypothetical protein HMPREF1619_05139 [Klebsiella pneumoniae 909957]|nr:hypothetical protein HMPREF1619_05139 [Klebsiella pneumoniae 909957]KXA20829.1 hypothetical protein HMPREF3197_05117 [Klebsiella pneumoniae]
MWRGNIGQWRRTILFGHDKREVEILPAECIPRAIKPVPLNPAY